MGLFDEVKVGYLYLPRIFRDGVCQTKDLGCNMDFFHLDPAGHLYLVDFEGANDIVWDEGKPWAFRWKYTGKHGRVKACDYTGIVRIYPSRWGRKWGKWPEAQLLLVEGKVEWFREY